MRVLCHCGNYMEKSQKILGVKFDVKIFGCLVCGNSIEVMN